ncbi:hypothetical protein [Caballeronia sp. RCC_10]|jgi:hypothetical protein|uniref:hypothetical protein n=1 Tax=Caballeronia sp. RCC_10 TaxID=3239227 RepID=UPI0035262CCF
MAKSAKCEWKIAAANKKYKQEAGAVEKVFDHKKAGAAKERDAAIGCTLWFQWSMRLGLIAKGRCDVHENRDGMRLSVSRVCIELRTTFSGNVVTTAVIVQGPAVQFFMS